ncbi:M23 family metallopeptidase [Candidatus Saccharibacteria bacterium]|nr:M23 family metallopeptidase [Candidatus Saccharibacteria bacterium]
MLKDTQNKPTTPNKDDPIQEHYNRQFAGIVGNMDKETPHPLGRTESNPLDLARRSEEQSSSGHNKNNMPESDKIRYLSSHDDNGSNFLTKIKSKAVRMSNKKKAAGIAGILALVGVIVSFGFGFLTMFQLVHLDEYVAGRADAPTKRILNRRAVKHYEIIFNEDGKGYYNRVNKPVYGVVTERYLNTNPRKVIDDLKSKGYDVGIDSEDGKLYLNGKKLDGKISDRRSQIRGIMDKEYANEGWIKRYTRTKTLFRSLGIKRVFFENTREKVDNWELKFIKRIRDLSRRDGVDVNTDSSNKDYTDADGNKVDSVPGLDTDKIEADAAEIRDKLQDPKYNPEIDANANNIDFNGKFDDLLNLKNVDLENIGKGTATSAVRIDGVLQTTCEIKAFVKGVELAAKAYRYRALVQYAAPVLVAAHQVKTGEGVSAAQMSGLMAILNRSPGIASSGAYQTLAGNGGISKIKNTDRYSLSFNSGAGGVLNAINSKADSLMGEVGRDTCKKARSVLWSVGSITIGVGAAVFTGGTSVIPNAIAGIIKSAFIGIAEVVATPLLANMIAGNIVNGYESGDKAGDAFVGGVAAMSATQRWSLGGSPVSTKQAMVIQQQIAQAENEEKAKASVFDKYFSLANSKSLAVNFLMGMKKVKAGDDSYIQSILSQPSNIARTLTPKSIAAEPTGLVAVNEAFGIQDYDVPDIPDGPDEVEKWNKEHEGVYAAWMDKCHNVDKNQNVAMGVPINQEDEDIMAECTKEDKESGYRLSNYMADRAISTGIAFNANVSDCMDPDKDEWDCEYSEGGSDPSGDSSEEGAFILGDYAWPVSIYKKDISSGYEWPCDGKCHWDSSYAFDLSDKRAVKDSSNDDTAVGQSVYAITDGKMWLTKQIGGVEGCYGFHLLGKDGYDYYYGHVRNPILSNQNATKQVKKGDKIAEIGRRDCTLNGSYPHLHIDQSKEFYHQPGSRTKNLNKILNDLYEQLPDEAPTDTGKVASRDGWVWPIRKRDFNGDITNCWRKPGHTGIDIGVSTGTMVYAPKDGEIVATGGPGGDAGNYMIIKHDGNRWTNYQHLSSFIKKKGVVSAGEPIAKSGNTGDYTTGPHLHFSVTNAETLSSRTTGQNTLNPLDYLPVNGPGTVSCGR